MRNKYGRAYTKPIGPWPGTEAEDASWEVNSPIDEPECLPPIGVRVECIWIVADTEHNTLRQSRGYATMVGDRHWNNDAGCQLVFNPSLWRLPQ